jgi:hypothetical protein
MKVLPPMLVAIASALVLALGGLAAAGARGPDAQGPAKACHAHLAPGVIAGKKVCLKAGQRCLRAYDTQYHRFGFHCHAGGRLTRRRARPPATTTAPRLGVLRRSSLDAPGYVFVAPKDGAGQQGPEIVDDRGRPVWFHPISHGDQATDFRVQRYRGEPVLTWWQVSGFGGVASGVAYVANSSYHVIATLHAGNGLGANGHELALTPQGTALITIEHEVPYDLSSVGGPKDGKVDEGVVQEIDVASGRVLFEWHSLDQVALDESYAPVESPYDYFHINAVNLDSDGNLLLSGRHTWTVYKNERATGDRIRRLGGKRSDFKLGPGAQFAWQHDPLPAGDGTLRLFDNEGNGSTRVLSHSRVIWLHLDSAAGTATLVKEIPHPLGLSAASQGNAQGLDNGNTFVGWGALGRVSEFDPQGKLLFDAVLPTRFDTYRGYRAAWVGRPDTQPTATAWTNANGTTTVHAIWNGATEVAAWRVRGGREPNALAPIRTARWDGLDTTLKIPGVPQEVQVVALDAHGNVIGTSRPVRVD